MKDEEDIIGRFDSWEKVLEEESKKQDKEYYEHFLKCHLDVLSVSELFRIIGKDTIVQWINQFEKEDQDVAFSILRRIKYYSSEDVFQFCKLNYSNWIIECDASVKETLFIPLGGAGKSGSMIGYLFRMANNIPKKNYCSLYEIEQCGYVFDDKIKDIVLLDDYSGTGDQFIKDEILNNILTHAKEKIRVSFLPIVMSRQAKNRIEEQTNVQIYCQQIREEREYSEVEDALIRRYGKELFVHDGEDLRYGWGCMGETIAFFYNVPNNSLPIIWSNDYSAETNANWIPLFPRVNPGENAEIIEVIRNTIQIPRMVSEDYMIFIQAFTDAYILLRDKKVTFSFKDLYDMQYCMAQMMYPYNLGLTYHTPFKYLQQLRIKMLKFIKDSLELSEVNKSDLIGFFTVDYPIIDQGCLIEEQYASILAEYVINHALDLSEFICCINREMDKSKKLVYEIEGFIALAKKVKKRRGVTERERDYYGQLLKNCRNETLRYWISKCFYNEKCIDDISESDVYVIVNNYGKYQVLMLSLAKEYKLV